MRPDLLLMAAMAVVVLAVTAGRAAGSTYGGAVSGTVGLVAYWPFDGGLDDVVGGVAGTAHGLVHFDAGIGGTPGLSLDGRAFVAVPPISAADARESTVELFYRALPSPSSGNPCLISIRDEKRARVSLHLSADMKRLAVWNGGGAGWVRVAPEAGLGEGTWHHLALTQGREGVRLYLDGVPWQGAVGPSAEKGLPIQIGAPTAAGDFEVFCGTVDEVALYSRALSAEEVAAHVDAASEEWAARRQQMAAVQLAYAEEEARRQAADRAARREQVAGMLSDAALLERGERRIYQGDHLGAIRFGVGGIGAGTIQMDGHARFAAWQIFNNHTEAELPDSFLAIAAAAGDGPRVVRCLQTAPAGPFAPMEGLTFRGEYPLAWYEFEDAALPVTARLEAFSPLIPLRTQDSAIPCAILRVGVANPTGLEAEVSVLAVQQNAVGYLGQGPIEGVAHADYGGNRNEVVTAGGGALLHMTSEKGPGRPGCGSMALVALGPSVTGSADAGDLAALQAGLAAGRMPVGSTGAGPSPSGSTLDGVLASSFRLGPGESQTVTFILAWYFPNADHGSPGSGWNHHGNQYASVWRSAADVADYVRADLGRLTQETKGFHQAVYESNLPHWLLDRVTSQLAVLRSRTCYWAKDGYFGAWEGCGQGNGCCAGNCTHVWHYAQAHARLFPDLARRMREQSLSYQREDGSLPFRHPWESAATDGELGEILGVWREHLCSTDGTWLRRVWPRTRAAMEHAIRTWDADEDGVLAGYQWNTLDCAVGGSTSWLGSLYLAALAACERMATLQGEPELAARYGAIRARGAATQDSTLFNGEYYIQLPDPEPRNDYADGCAIDQLLGEWWAGQVGLPAAYPNDHARRALSALIEHNFRPTLAGVTQLPRKFVADGDAGLQMIQWPKGDRPSPCILYGDEIMTGFEYAAAATMVQKGMLREGLMVVKAISDRYDGRLREGLTPGDSASWGHSGNPFGDDECGKYYGRAMSVWSLLLACQGLSYDGPAGSIGFAPVWQPDDHVSFFTAAEGWGVYRQRRVPGALRAVLDVRFGQVRVRELTLALPDGATCHGGRVSIGGSPVPAAFATEAGRFRIALEGDRSVQPGEELVAELSLDG